MSFYPVDLEINHPARRYPQLDQSLNFFLPPPWIQVPENKSWAFCGMRRDGGVDFDHIYTGCWYTPLKNDGVKVTWGYEIPNIWGTCSKPPTSIVCAYHLGTKTVWWYMMMHRYASELLCCIWVSTNLQNPLDDSRKCHNDISIYWQFHLPSTLLANIS